MWLKTAQNLLTEHSHSSTAQQKETTNGLYTTKTAMHFRNSKLIKKEV